MTKMCGTLIPLYVVHIIFTMGAETFNHIFEVYTGANHATSMFVFITMVQLLNLI